uniref:Activating signal cointegrator 1 complex subunit 3 n=1 Tax=Ciona savignyi TaxID=51511 RepID=H2ZDK8_CIOSA
GIDESNALILPDKSDTKVKKEQIKPLPRKLSKKQRKNYEKILDQKRKKEKRSALLESLSSVQVSTSELAMLDSTAHLGTRNSKLSDLREAITNNEGNNGFQINSLSGKRKRRKLLRKVAIEEDPLDETSSSDDEPQSSDSHEDSKDLELKPETFNAKSDGNGEIIVSDTTEDISSTSTLKENLNDNAQEQQVTIPEVLKPVTYVHLDRTAAIQESRLALPILGEEQVIMEAINGNQVVIICGETGSGKTTQVPQFLYEAGYARAGMIGVTEPRRVAAVNMSKRVAIEMNLPTTKVSYQIRYDNNVTKETCLKFMTDGVLAQEMKQDFLLTKYSVLILDEAHERTANTDLLIGLLSRVVPLRNKKGNPLKLIIMSATLRVEDFTKNERLFKVPPPVLKISTRQFPVTVHFSKKTPQNECEDGLGYAYLDEAFKKICKIHRTLPPGGILVFVTGKQEVHALKRKLTQTFPSNMPATTEPNNNEEVLGWFSTYKGFIFIVVLCHNIISLVIPDVKSIKTLVLFQVKDDKKENLPQMINLDDYKTNPDNEENVEEKYHHPDLLLSEEENESDSELLMDDSAYSAENDRVLPMQVLPLYAMLPPHKQKLVFEPVPLGSRLCVVATNVAETSLTIPGIKYIVDTGKVKRRVYDKTTGVSTFRIGWVSKASANQRAGRAGRTESGHTYRLFSSAVFQDFDEFDLPEISSKPVAGLVLQMKSMNIDRVLGRLIASFPVHPRYGKMIAMAIDQKSNVVEYVITIVAALTVKELFASFQYDADQDQDKVGLQMQLAARLQHMKVLWCTGGGPQRRLLGDPMVYLGAIGAAEFAGATPSYCANNCLRPKAVIEIRKLRSQLTNLVNSVQPDYTIEVNPKMNPPIDIQVKHLRQILLSAMPDQVARCIPTGEMVAGEAKKLKGAYRCALMDEPVFIHPESILSRDPLPVFLVFQEITEMKEGKKIYMRDVTEIDPSWLATFCPQHCVFSKPLEEPSPTYDPVSDDVKCVVTATYGRLSWPLGQVVITYPPGLDRIIYLRSSSSNWVGAFLPDKCYSFQKSAMSCLNFYIFSLQPRTESMLKSLAGAGVDSKQKLVKMWKENPTYLREEILEWLAPASHQHFLSAWPL